MFIRKGISLKTTVLLPIMLVGILGLVAATVTGEIYRTLILDNTQHNLANLIKLEAKKLLSEYKEIAEDFGISTQKQKDFKKAVVARDIPLLQELLDDEFHKYYVTTGVLDVKALYIYDKDYKLITTSREGFPVILEEPACEIEIDIARQRQGLDRHKSQAALCVHEEHTFHSIITPIGTLKTIGYLQAITDPTNAFLNVEHDLGMPAKLLDQALETRYQSRNWPENTEQENMLVGIYSLQSSDEIPALTIAIARDISLLNLQLSETRSRILVTGTAAAIAAVLLFLFFINRNVLNPLASLSRELDNMGRNRKNIGETVKLRGNMEIRQLAESYNAMSKELHSAYEELEAMAYTDPLTTLPNRSLLQRQLVLHTELVKNSKLTFALFMMDLDKFKAVNDTLGHHAGDDLLQQVSQRLTNVLRRSDTLTRLDENEILEIENKNVARLGGDEFAAILPSVTDDEDALIVARKIIAEFERPFTIEGNDFNVGVSIGIAIAPAHGKDPATLMRHADSAMYIAKNSHSGFHIYNPEDDNNDVENLRFDTDLRVAIAKQEMELYYQPKFDLRHQQVIGCEALIRWHSAEHGDVPADKIIEHAEETDLILPLTHWVLEEALKRCREWHDQGYKLSVAVNLSTKCLQDRGFLTLTEQLLNRFKLEAKYLFFEITETTIMVDPKRALHVLYGLGKLGIKVSIDDFGTGYSSLSYLKQLPVDEIKIDRSFVMDMLSDTNDKIIVHSIVDLAHNMGLRVVAEGVQEESTLRELEELGCDQVQGFYFSPACSADNFLSWLANSSWKIHKH